MKGKKVLTLIFIAEKSKNHRKLLYQRKEGMFIVKFKKFGVDWYIPYEMAADSARGGGGFVRPPLTPPSLKRVKSQQPRDGSGL